MKKIVLILFLLAGCDSHSHDDHDHPHGAAPEERTIATTAWSDRFEIFMEHPALVAGTPARFAIHVTDLSTFEARSAGAVTVQLAREGAAPIEHVEPQPARPGIYVPTVKLDSPGTWKMSLRFPAPDGERRVDLPALTVHASAEEARKASIPEPPEGITLLKEQQWKLGTRTAVVAKRRVVERLRRPGRVVAKPGTRASVTPPVEGMLLAPPGKLLPALGDRVESGQVVALVQPPFSEFAAKLAEARANEEKTRLAAEQTVVVLDRTRKLHAANAKTQRELQEAEYAQRSAAADHESAKAVHEAWRRAGAVFTSGDGRGLPAFEMKTPLAGVVVEILASPGEHVDPERGILTLLDPGVVHIEARFAEADLGRITSAPGAFYETPGARGTYVPILGEGGGKIAFLGLEVDPQSRTVPLVFEVPNPDRRLLVGMTLTLHVETASAGEDLAVPLTALVDEEARHVAFVQSAGETFEKRDVTIGVRDAGWVQVLGGLAEGDRVVIHGAYAVRLASLATSIPAHGHAH